MKAFSPNQIKADLLFIISIVATFGFNLTNIQTVALLGASGLIAVAANFAEAHIHVGAKLSGSIDKVLLEVRGLLPAINQLVAGLPGQIGAEVKKVLELVEKGPQGTETIVPQGAPKGGSAAKATK